MSASPVAIAAPRVRRVLNRPRTIALVATVSVVLALVLAYIGTNAWASVQQDSLRTRFDAASARWEKLDPLGRSSVTYDAGDPIARIAIPSIGLDAVVAEGVTAGVLRRGPGHLPSSATPGENGVAIVTANRFAFGSFFMRLDRVAVGDTIVAQSAIGRTTFTVVDVSVVPVDQLDLSADSSDRVLLLFAGDHFWGGGDRLLVRALADQGA